MYIKDTIAAVATPPGPGGIAIVRTSGPDAERIAAGIFVSSGGTESQTFVSHRLHHGHVRDPRTGSIFDEVLLAFMRAPRSYTGEDTVEIQCHGSPFIVRTVLHLILARGARHAEAGEFTKRAFLNGRLDLAQAEGVLELVQANSAKAAGIALGQLGGGLSNLIAVLREDLVQVLVQIEAAIDFPEEDIELVHQGELSGRVRSLIGNIESLIASYQWGKLIREGVRICILGRPNVGKSSLLNALLGEERAIVTAIPGTTRDFIEETVNLDGLPATLWDTAGVRVGADGIERLGIDRTWAKVEDSDGILIVVDGSLPVTTEDQYIMDSVQAKKGIVVINKADLPQSFSSSAVSGTLAEWPRISVSALQHQGLAALKEELRQCFINSTAEEPEVIVTNSRHKAALERAKHSLDEVLSTLTEGMPPEMVAVDLQGARESLETIIGTVTNDEVLDRIFSQFCIGK